MSPSRARALIFLTLSASLAVYLLGNSRVGLWDRDEPRYAQSSRQMLQTGDWVTPRFLDAWRAKKPPLIYWCQAASMALLGDNAAAARLPSALAIELTALLIAIGLWRTVGPARAAWTVLIFCTSALVIASAKMSITDAVQLLWIVICQICLCRMRSDDQRKAPTAIFVPIIFWISLALGLLTKGMIPLVLIAAMLALAILEIGPRWKLASAWLDATRWWRRTRPLIGIPIAAAVLAPWIILIHSRSPGFLSNLGNEAAGHSVAAAEGHGGFPGYHTLLLGGTFFPWILFLPAAIVSAIRFRHRTEIRLAIAAFIGPWILMESLGTRLPHYVLPAFPPLAFLTADALQRALDGDPKNLINRPRLFKIGVSILALFVVVFAIAPWLLAGQFHDLPLNPLAMSSALCAVIAVSLLAMLKYRQIVGVVLVMAIGMLAAFASLYTLFIPAAPYLQVSSLVADSITANGYQPAQGNIAMIDYKEPSLAFALHGHAYEADDEVLISMATRATPAWAVTTRTDFDNLPAAVRSRLDVLSESLGVSYNGSSRTVQVLVVRPRR
jgi:4-amino-4-deoxy-L-arabinose transferase-like glycosyltransferase